MDRLKLWLERLRNRQDEPDLDEMINQHEQTMSQDPYAFQVAHRRLAWMFRLSIGVIVVLSLVIITLSNIISVVVPLKEVRVALLRVDQEDDRVYRVEPISKDVPGFDLLMEARAGRMVSLLLTIDSVSQDERFNEAFRYVSDEYYEKFSTSRFEQIKEAIDSGLNRSIVVESVSRIDSKAGVYKYAVDFLQTDERKGKTLSVKKHRAYLNLTTRPKQVKEADKYENPLGVILVDMSVKNKKESKT